MKLFKVWPTIILILLAASDLFATAQISDKIIYKGKEYFLQSMPLERFFLENPSRKPASETMTALWRGYRAEFEVREGALFVNDIEIIRNPEEGFVSAMEEVFPTGAAKASWYSGILVIPYGEVTGYEKDRFSAIYSNYMIIEIKQGNVCKIKKFSAKGYNKFMDMQFAKFRHTPAYESARKKVLTQFPEGDMDFIDGYIRQNLTDYIPGIL